MIPLLCNAKFKFLGWNTMSRKTDFEKYITKATSFDQIQAEGQGEDGRVVRAGIIVAAQKGNATALRALFPLIACKDEFLNDVLDIIFLGKHKNNWELVQSIPDNTARDLKWMKIVTGGEDNIWSEMVRVFALNDRELFDAGILAARADCPKTVAAVLLKNKHVSADVLIESWTRASCEVIEMLIPHITKLDPFLKNLTTSFNFWGSPQHLVGPYEMITDLVDNEKAKRQKYKLEKSIKITTNASKTSTPKKRKM